MLNLAIPLAIFALSPTSHGDTSALQMEPAAAPKARPQTSFEWTNERPAAGTAHGADSLENPRDPAEGVSCPDNAPLYCQTGNYCCPNALPYCCGNMLCGETSSCGAPSCDAGQVDCSDWCCGSGTVCGSPGSNACCPSTAPYHCAATSTCSADPDACGGGGDSGGSGGGSCNPGDTTCPDGCCPAGSVCGTPGTNKCCPSTAPYHCAATSTCSADPDACGGGGDSGCAPGQTSCPDGCCAAGSVCGTPGTNTCCPDDTPFHCPASGTCSASSTGCSSDDSGSPDPGPDPAGYLCAAENVPGADCGYIRFCVSEADSCDGYYEADSVTFDCNACDASSLQACASDVVDYCVDSGGGGGSGYDDDDGSSDSGRNRSRNGGCSTLPSSPAWPSLLLLSVLGIARRRFRRSR